MSGALRQFTARKASAVVFDSFDRADSTTSLGTADTGQAWTAHSGTWGISSNKAYLVSTTGQAIASVDAGITDIKVSADITLSGSNADTGLVFRVVDNNTYLLAVISAGSNDNITIFRRHLGSFAQAANLSSAGNVLGTTYDFRVEMVGLDIEVYRNDALQLSHTISYAGITDGIYDTPTRYGMRINGGQDSRSTRHDNFTVEAI